LVSGKGCTFVPNVLTPLPVRTARLGWAFYFLSMAKVPYSKEFLVYRAQIALLKSRGMMFDDERKALHLLENISYYRLSGYWYPLLCDKQNHVFKQNARFETAFNMYKFDSQLRKLISSELEKIEIAVRTKMAYVLSTAHNSFWVEDASHFSNQTIHQTTLEKLQEEIDRSDDEFIIAFKERYTNIFPPSFILMETSSFGALSRLYGNLKPGKDKKDIAKLFCLPDKVFASWLHCLVYIRNMCAHHARLWNRQVGIKPLFPRRTHNAWIDTNGISNRRLYYILSMIIYLLNTVNPNHTFKQKLEILFRKYPNVDRTAMGFPANWSTELLWK